jgi:hypothetical protein
MADEDLDDQAADGEQGDDHDRGDDDGVRAPRRSRRFWMAIAAAVVILAGLGIGLGLTLGSGSSGPVGPEGVPLQNVPDLASADTTVGGRSVDGITCRRFMDQTDPYHVHAHIAVFVNGHEMRVPAGAGITPPRASAQVPGGTFIDSGPTDCLYWLHTHADDGIIHIEAPSQQSFTLGQFFDIWNQPLGPDQVGPAKGAVVAFLNGRRFTGDPRDIPLEAQGVIQLDVGTPVVPFKPISFHVIGLCSTSCTALPGS